MSIFSEKPQAEKRQGRMFFFLLLFIIFTGVFFCRDASAQKVSSGNRIDFTDNSGKYLLRQGSDWYLKDKKGNTLTSIQYLKTGNQQGFSNGFYVFGKKGNLLQKKAVYKYENRKINGVTFNGYYYASTDRGKLCTNVQGIVYIEKQYSLGKLFWGYYYVGSYGQLSDRPQVRLLPQVTVHGNTFYKGYYYCYSDGRLCVQQDFHKYTGKAGGRSFDGEYFFGGTNGKLFEKGGWINYNNEKYCIEASTGKKMTNCWKDNYYLLSDGRIARNTRLPDGSYADGRGLRYLEGASLATLTTTLKAQIQRYPGTWAVYVKDLSKGNYVRINDTAIMYPASTIKTFAMASVFEQIRLGKLSCSSSVKSLLWDMITESDNTAFNTLVPMLSPSRGWTDGCQAMNQFISGCGYSGTRVHHTLRPASGPSLSDGKGNNTSSAYEAGRIMEKIYRGQCVSPYYSDQMLGLLLNQKRRYKIPAGVPAGIRVANKTGETNSCQHDMAIVYGARSTYVITVFSQNVSEETGIRGVKEISRTVYNYLNQQPQ